MISFNRMLGFIGAEPFRPFLIRTTDGQIVFVRQPDTAWVGKTRLLVCVPPADEPDRPPQWREIPLAEIASVE